MSHDIRDPASVPSPDELAYIWREYEYRHDLCWRAVYKVTFAVLALAIVPYPKDNLTRALGEGALVPPVIAMFLAAFGILLVRNELRLFAKTKLAHHSMQDRFWDRIMGTSDDQETIRKEIKHNLTPARAHRTEFDLFVMTYMVLLFLVSAANTLFMAYCWIPRLRGL